MRWVIDIPPASAKRLESIRHLVIREDGAFRTKEHRLPIPVGASQLTFDFEFKENDPNVNQYVLDADVYYSVFVEYQNSTGSRVERTVDLRESLQGAA